MLDKQSILGFIIGFGLIAFAILSEGSILLFISFSSFLIVFGGTVAATMIHYSWNNIKDSFSTMTAMMGSGQADLRTDIELIKLFAKRARKDGLIQLESDVEDIQYTYLKNGLQLAIDGVTKDSLDEILLDEISSTQRRVEISVNVMGSMATYAPAFGMIGTVVGMILMLQNISDPAALGAGLAIALITTLYGSILSNLVFAPLGGKLEYLSEIDLNRKAMFRSAIISIVEGENPRLM
jgi:chemotaxis protein MotA